MRLGLLDLALAGQVAGLAALAEETHEANAAFEHAQLQLELRQQEVVDQARMGADVKRLLQQEQQELSVEANATDWLQRTAATLRRKDALLGKRIAQVEAWEAEDEAALQTAAANAVQRSKEGLDAKVRLLHGKEANVTAAAKSVDAKLANATLELQPGALDKRLHSAVKASKAEVAELKRKAKLELRALKAKEKVAQPLELAALRWQVGSVKTDYLRARAAAVSPAQHLEEQRRVLEISKPLLAAKSKKLHAKLRHLQNEVGTVERAAQQAQADDDALEAQVQDLHAKAGALAAQSGEPLPAPKGPPRKELQQLQRKRQRLLAQRNAVEQSLNQTAKDASYKLWLRKQDLQSEQREAPRAQPGLAPLEAAALDQELATDPDAY